MTEQAIENPLGKERIGKLLLKLSLPAITAQVINALYNIVDRMYIGNIPEIGKSALTGVGVAFPLIIIITAFSALVGMGGAPLAAIKMGEKDDQGAEKILGNCVTLLLGIGIVLTIVFSIFKDPLLLAFGASEETLGYASSYLGIYLIGTVFVQVSVGLNAFISTQGLALMSMITVIIGAVLNIVLDPIFIFVFDMGVPGAALATILSQGVSAVWVFCFLLSKRSRLRIKKQNLRLQKKVVLAALGLGLSPFIMQSTESLVIVSLNTSLRQYGGDLAVCAMTILSSVMQFVMLPMNGLTQGAQPIISYNFGARNTARVYKTFRLLLTCCLTYTILFWSAVMLFPEAFIRIFNQDPELLQSAVWQIRLYFGTILMFGAQIACQQTFVALGQAKKSMLLALLRKVILLVPLIYILPNFFSNKVFAVILAEPIADFLATATTVTVFLLSIKKILRAAEER